MVNFIQRFVKARVSPHAATLDRTVARPPHPATVVQPKTSALARVSERLPAHPAKVANGSSLVAQRADLSDHSSSEMEEDSGSDYEETSDDGDDEFYEYHERAAFDHTTIPRNRVVTKRVRGVVYSFKYTGNGTVDFQKPETGYPAATILEDVNICDPTNQDRIVGTTLPLKQPRGDNSAHFRAANQLTRRGNSTTSPKGYTWHHHPEKGRMQLIDRKVHAEFKHVGGKAIWGTV